MVRIGYCNVDGFKGNVIGNSKVRAITRYAQKHDLDAFFGAEVNINWKKMPEAGQLPELFRSENAIRTVASYNKFENWGKLQQGGTFGLAFGLLASKVIEVGSDDLGRWSWMIFLGKDGHKVRIVVAYQPVPSKATQIGSVYQQHRRQQAADGCPDVNPCTKFRTDLVAMLRQCRRNNERLILLVDANENTITGKLNTALTGSGLQMREAVRALHPSLPATPTFLRGKRCGRHPIDAAYLSPDLPLEAGSWISAKRSPGDHRSCILEIRWKAFVGEHLFRIARPDARRLTTAVHRSTVNYERLFLKQEAQHKLLHKTHALYKEQHGPLSQVQEKQMETIDRVKTDAMIHSAKNCRPLCMGEIDFSLDINKVKGQRLVWHMIVNYRSGIKESSEKIRRIAKAVGIVGNPLHDSITLREAQRSLKAADDKYKEMKPHAPMMREDWLRDRSRDQSLPAIARKRAEQQLVHERQRDNARRMKHVRGKRRAGAVRKVGIGEGDAYREYEDRATVERLIIENNAARFRLTEDTPPMTEPLLSDLGYLADTAAAEQILQGTYVCPPEMDQYTRDFLQFLQRSPNVDATDLIDTTFTSEDFIAYWKKSNERTSSSISTLHFGHYKTAIRNKKLSELHAVFLDIALNSGYSPKRWQKGLTVMLEKKKGVILVNKLRAILLMEGDLNCANKTIFGKRMMEFAEERGEIPEECVGSRRNHRASEVSLQRRLFCDIVRQKRCSAAICCVDLEQCYDRIAHSIASLGARRWGVPQVAITCLLTTVQLMLFFLRTAHGDSESFYSAATDPVAQNSGNTHPYQGTCQGNGAGPGIFLGISAPCVLYMHGKGFAARLVSAFSTGIFCIIGILYVDDTDLLAIASHPSESAEHVAVRMQDMVNHWRGCLLVTGGNLNPDKCNETLIGFYWDTDGQWHYRTNIVASITIPDSNGVMQAIESLGPSDATTVVGVIQAADGNMTDQVQKLKEDADDVGDRISKGYLPRRLVWQTLRTMVWPSISYPLSSTTISEEESYEITKSLYFQILPSGGANRNFPTPYRHAPYSFFGLSLPRAIDTEFIGQVISMLTHGAIPSHTGNLLNISLEQAQLEVGIGTPLLEANYDDYGFLLTFCWIKVLWKRLWEYDVVLRQPEAEMVLPKLQREGDFFIMERIVQSQGFSEEEMIRMNRCRLAFRAMTIADVLTGDGAKVTNEAKSILRLNRPSSSWDWPNEHPCDRDISRWKAGLRRITSENFSLPFDMRLGRWIQQPHLKWQWFYWRRERTLFRRVNNVWHKWIPFSPRATVAFKRVSIVSDLPVPLDQLERATTREVQGRMMFEGAAGNKYTVDPTYVNIHEFIEKWEDSWPIAESYFPPDPTLVAQAISNGTAVMVSDGSYKALLSTEIGAAAWILECSQTGATCCGECSTSGLRNEVNAYRSELQGCHAGLLGLYAFSIYHQLQGGSVTFHFDNDAGVDKSAERHLNVPERYKHADLVRAIRVIVFRLRTEHDIIITFDKVQGHRLRHVRYDQLTRPEQLNEMMDIRAKARVDRIFSQRIPPAPKSIKFEGWSFWIDDIKATTDPTDMLLQRIHEGTMRDWLSRPDHLRMTAAGFDLVNWQSVHTSLKGFPEMFRVWASKHMSRFCGVGRMQHICGFWDNSRCPRCKEDNETTTHILICPDEDAGREWRNRVANLGIWLLEMDTHPSIKTCIMESLSLRTTTTLFSPNADHICMTAALEQDEIGWQNFVEGKISKSWGVLQWNHYQEQLSVRSGDKWSAGLVTQLLELTHGMWKHRNSILHAVDAQGLPLQQAAELEAAIHSEFRKGTEGLARKDQHFIRRGRDDVFSMSVIDKRGWLRGIQLARESQVTAPPAHQQQQQLMIDFFRMTDD